MDSNRQGSSTKKAVFLRNAGLMLLVFTAAGFALKGVVHPERLARYTPIVIAHGFFMLAWLAMFAWQAHLVTRSEVHQHKKNGRMAWILVLLMIGTSVPVSYSLMVEIQRAPVFIGNLFMLIAFLGFFLFALMKIRAKDLESHKRYMLFACFSILMPGLGRYSEVFFGSEEPSLFLFLVIVIAVPLIYDRSTGQRFHRATLWGIAMSILWVVLMIAAIATPIGPMILERVG